MTGPLYPQPAPSLGQDQNGMSAGPLGSLAPLLANLGNELARRQEATQQILVQKGQLALEQEKQTAQEEQIKLQNKERKQKTEQLQQMGQSLNAALEKAQSPEDFVAALKSNLGQMMIADPGQAMGMAQAIGGLQQTMATRAKDQDENMRIASVIQANPGALADPIKGRAMLQVIAGINPTKARDLASTLAPDKNTVVSSTPGETTTVLGPDNKPVFTQTGAARPVGPPKPDQLNQAELGASALKQWADIEQLRTRNPQVEQQVGAILSAPTFVSAIPGMKNRGDAVQAAIKAGAKGDVLSYLRTKFGFMDSIIRTRIAGGRLSGPIWGVYAAELLPGADSGNPEANAAMRENEKQAILSAVGKSGYDENPDIWNRAAKRHGVPFSVEDFMAGTFDHKLADIQNRY